MGLIEHTQNTHWRSKPSACFFLFSRRWRSHDSTNNRRTVYGLGPRPGPQGRGLDQPQPHGGGGHREGWPSDRPGVPRQMRRPSRRASRLGQLPRGPRRGHHLRNAGALLPPRPPAALHRRDLRGRHHPRGRRLRGPQPSGRRKGPGHLTQPRRRRDRGRLGRRVQSPQRCLFPLHPDRPPLRRAEIRHDPGRESGHAHGGIPVDHRARSARAGASRPTPVRSHHGGHRHRPSR